MEDLERPYTREEILVAGDGFPSRGLLCTKCRTRIPQFVELSAADESRVRHLILEGRTTLAIAELRAATHCCERWAKIWVIHSGRPARVVPGPPCPYCGKPLRTATAKQCPHCLRAWHKDAGDAGR
jgi:hypothetical protein